MKDGIWNIKSCIGNKLLKEINPTNMIGLTKDQIVKQIKNLINNYYLFLGYIEFANFIAKKSQDSSSKNNLRKLKDYFTNRLIIIDEVHNIGYDDNQNKSCTRLLNSKRR